MKARGNAWLLLIGVAAWAPASGASPAPEFCKVLRTFVASVQPDEIREFTFRTSWGANFKGEPELALGARSCEHGGYAPARQVCVYLMEHGSTEFAGLNVKDAVSCLSRKTKFDDRLELERASFHFSYGSGDRGALIDVTLDEDPVVGGMAFRLVADGY